MKNMLAALLLAAPFVLSAQDHALKPFYHGVASGDALSDRVIIWTRVSDTTGTVTVDWKMSTDTALCVVVQSGAATTDASKDFTVKVDVTGLQPETWYYYQFTINGKTSLVGRTRTLPAGNSGHFRAGVVSCSNYSTGTYFNAYLSLARRNDVHAVIHLGDYIYEGSEGGNSGSGVLILPDHEIITLDDYRQRYNSYRLDPYLRFIHQQYPFYTVWDDHETANNAWEGGAGGHTPGTEGNWEDRKAYGKQANFEWLPKREQAPGDYTIYRTFSIGNLADLIMLDTRLEGRSQQVSPLDQSALQDPNRTILGATQMQWFKDQLSNSTARWKIVGQQVMMAPLELAGFILNADQWDGYQADRTKVVDHVLNNNIENVVFLTGDIHSSWASDIPGPNYNASTGAGSAFVEYVTTSITSQGSPVSLDPRPFNPHIKYAELTKRGYLILDVDSNRAQSDWVYVSSITTSSFTEEEAASWYVNAGERFLRNASSPVSGYTNTAPLAPSSTGPIICTGVDEREASPLVTMIPNPFTGGFSVKFNRQLSMPANLKLYSISGKMILEKTVGLSENEITIDESSLSAGSYLLMVESGELKMKTTVVKAQ